MDRAPSKNRRICFSHHTDQPKQVHRNFRGPDCFLLKSQIVALEHISLDIQEDHRAWKRLFVGDRGVCGKSARFPVCGVAGACNRPSPSGDGGETGGEFNGGRLEKEGLAIPELRAGDWKCVAEEGFLTTVPLRSTPVLDNCTLSSGTGEAARTDATLDVCGRMGDSSTRFALAQGTSVKSPGAVLFRETLRTRGLRACLGGLRGLSVPARAEPDSWGECPARSGTGGFPGL